MRQLIVPVLIAISCSYSFAQESSIVVIGKVVQHPPIGFGELMIINVTSGRGIIGGSDGSFEINIRKEDELKVFCTGFKTVTVSFRDSIFKPVYNIIVELKELQIVFDKPVIIRPQPTYEELEDARSKIGTHRYDPLIQSPATTIFNPITALYQAFSRKEQEKKIYAELLNQKQLEDALKDITRYLVSSGLFDLDDDEMELFLATCPLSQEFVRTASLYDVSAALGSCYYAFKSKRRY